MPSAARLGLARPCGLRSAAASRAQAALCLALEPADRRRACALACCAVLPIVREPGPHVARAARRRARAAARCAPTRSQRDAGRRAVAACRSRRGRSAPRDGGALGRSGRRPSPRAFLARAPAPVLAATSRCYPRPPVSFETAIYQWDEGSAACATRRAERAPLLERVIERGRRRAAPPPRRALHDRGAGRPLRAGHRLVAATLAVAGRARGPARRGTPASSPTRPSPATCARPRTTPAAARTRLAPSLVAVAVVVLVAGAADDDLVVLDVTSTGRWPAQCSA